MPARASGDDVCFSDLTSDARCDCMGRRPSAALDQQTILRGPALWVNLANVYEGIKGPDESNSQIRDLVPVASAAIGDSGGYGWT